MADELIFICYSRADSAVALEIASRLRREGRRSWIDQHDIPAGDRWDDSIDDALKGATRLVAVLSPSAIASDQVKDELRFARERGVPIVPVLVEPCDLPYWLARVQYVDARDWRDAAWTRLIRELGPTVVEQPTPDLEPVPTLDERLFPTVGVYPGRTTVAELEELGARPSERSNDLELVDAPEFRFGSSGGIIDTIHFYGRPGISLSKADFPRKWREAGLNTDLTRSGWEAWFNENRLTPRIDPEVSGDHETVYMFDFVGSRGARFSVWVDLFWSEPPSDASVPDRCDITFLVS